MVTIDTSTDFGKRVAGQVQDEEVVWLTTVGADGTPHPSAVWFLWTDDEFLVLSQPDKPKLRNIGRNPGVAVNFNTDPLGSHITTFTGTARLDGVDPTPEEMAAYDAKYAASITRIGYTVDEFHAAYSVPLRVTPEKLRGF